MTGALESGDRFTSQINAVTATKVYYFDTKVDRSTDKQPSGQVSSLACSTVNFSVASDGKCSVTPVVHSALSLGIHSVSPALVLPNLG